MMTEARRRGGGITSSTAKQHQEVPLGNGGGDEPIVETRTTMSRKPKKKRRRSSRDEPFYILFLQTGAFVSIIFLIGFKIHEYLVPETRTDSSPSRDAANEYDDVYAAAVGGDGGTADAAVIVDNNQAVQPQQADLREAEQEQEYIPPPLPTFNLSLFANFDAFALSALEHKSSEKLKQDDHLINFWKAAKELRQDFDTYYGQRGRVLIDLGISTFAGNTPKSDSNEIPLDLRHTACRIISARNEKRPFRFTFGGYSVTVGRGNYFHQSFPFFMERKLKTVFRHLGVQLEVKNAAIGGCPSFPYGWCMPNFFGPNTDVISWDFSMNEAGGDFVGFEAYVRHALQLSGQPKLIVKDTFMAEERRNLLEYYLKQGLLRDPVVLHTELATEPFLSRFDRDLPPGFQEWRKFGAPKGAPGQALHHPAVKEHEFAGWLLTMHFLAALEVAAYSLESASKLGCSAEQIPSFMPEPLAFAQNLTARHPWSSVFYGDVVDADKGGLWKMRPMHCLTSFEPIVQGDLLPSAILGAVATDLDIMLPKSKMYYNRGWVLDLSESEKNAKRTLSLYDGLGFVDSKKAFYGILMSGTIYLHLPYEPRAGSSNFPKAGDKAIEWFRSVVICKVNEKRDVESCDVSTDLAFQIGGVNATESATAMDAAGTMYLGQKICVYIPVPSGAVLTTPAEMRANDKRSSTSNVVLPESKSKQDWEHCVGLEVGVAVHNHLIVKVADACSVSHAVWEQQDIE